MRVNRRWLEWLAPATILCAVLVRQAIAAPGAYSANFDSRHDVALSMIAKDAWRGAHTAGMNTLIGLGTHEWGTIRALDPVSIAFRVWGPVTGARVAIVMATLAVAGSIWVWTSVEGLPRLLRAWSAVISVLVFAGGDVAPVIFPDLYAINTTFPMYLAGGVLASACLATSLRAPAASRARLAALALTVTLAWWATVYTHYVVLVAPPLAVVAIVEIARAPSRRMVLRRLLAVACMVTFVLVATGIASYLGGFFADTSAVAMRHVYAWEPRSVRPITSVIVQSILPQHGLRAWSGPAVIAGIVLVGLGAWRRSAPSRRVATAATIALGMSVGYRLSERVWPREIGPSPAYVSWVLFPFIVVALVDAVAALGRRGIERRWSLCLAVGLALVVSVRATSLPLPGIEAWWSSPARHALDDALRPARSSADGSFGGRVVFMPRLASGEVLDAEVTAPFAEAMLSQVPLLNEHSHLQTPAFVEVATALLARPTDPQRRAHLTLRRPDRAILDLFGVRAVVTDAVRVDGYGTGQMASGLASLTRFGSDRIFRSDSFNDGTYSPTRQVMVGGLRGAVRAMSSDGFDPRRDVVVTDVQMPSLSRVSAASVTMRGTDIVLRATAEGHGLLVLPWEYSHCWTALEVADHSPSPTLRPVNGVLLGVVFDRTLAVTLRYEHRRLFGWRNCRLMDLADYRDHAER